MSNRYTCNLLTRETVPDRGTVTGTAQFKELVLAALSTADVPIPGRRLPVRSLHRVGAQTVALDTAAVRVRPGSAHRHALVQGRGVEDEAKQEVDQFLQQVDQEETGT